MFGFTLNHAVTSASLGVRVTGPVDIPVARRVVDDIEVTGRAGTLSRHLGWEDVTISLPLAVVGGIAGYHQVVVALEAARTIELTSQPGVYRRIKHVRVEPLRRELASWRLFEAEVCCQPFTYLTSGLQIQTLTASGTITNPGLLDAAPVITVHGTGRLELKINGTTHVLNAPSGRLTVDADRLATHVSGKTQTDGLTGPFPTLKPGVNRITLGAGISRVEIQGNWRNP